MIGSADLTKGLYFLATLPSPSSNTISSQATSPYIQIPKESLCHFKLGDLSNRIP